LGTVSIEYKQFGTRVDFVPIVLGNGNIRLEVRPAVTERDDAAGVNGVPAIRTRWVDTAAEMKAGQTLALAGLVQQQIEAENRGVPFIADLPWIGAAFRRVEHRVNEVELLVLVTPELVGPMDPHQVPHCLPGTFTTSPCDCELYGKGYLEVPKCCDGDCVSCDVGCVGCGGAVEYGHGMPYEGASPHMGPAPTPAHEEAPVPPSPQSQFQPRRIPPTESASPVFTPDSARNNSQNRANPARPAAPAANRTANSQPGLIGPLGYDVLE
jgi:pilus assembly protein CpaC